MFPNVYILQVGKTVSTKSVGSHRRCDITHSYKYEEGSMMERTTLGADEVKKASDVTLDVGFNQHVEIGEDFDIIVMVSQ